jgi:NAD-dependent deacetylase
LTEPAGAELERLYDEVGAALRRARRVLFITGAGISAESGLPTYRGIGGLYEDRDTDEDIPIEEALSGRMLARRPEVCWKYIAQIEAACRGARPSRAHALIAALQDQVERVVVLTQNVDGLHLAAGSRDVIAIHGDVHELYCTRCGDAQVVGDYAALTIPPRCGPCGGLVRPRVVLFGEMLPERELQRLIEELTLGFDLVFTVGTTSVFPYIAEPVVRARRQGVPTVEINPGESMVSAIVSHRLRMGAAEALTRVVERSGLALSV